MRARGARIAAPVFRQIPGVVKREWLATGDVLYAAWTGCCRSEIFLVDRIAAKERLTGL